MKKRSTSAAPAATPSPAGQRPVVRSTRPSTTEQRNPRSRCLDRLSIREGVELMLKEEARTLRGLRTEHRNIERAVDVIGRVLRQEGRLFYLGAGTSGRLGVLDAAECPPTFGCDTDRVQGLIAGGPMALWTSIEGAEDNAEAGARAVAERNVNGRDALVGLAASGQTPFVWGGLVEARRRGARTVLVCFNPYLDIPRALRPNIVIAPNVGPEVLTGSTRLKAGTATKILLNIFTTLAMVRAGKVISNLMVDLKPTNAKLRARAVRIVQDLSGADCATAEAALQKSRWVIRAALARLPSGGCPRGS